jgi:hypothetical protein
MDSLPFDSCTSCDKHLLYSHRKKKFYDVKRKEGVKCKICKCGAIECSSCDDFYQPFSGKEYACYDCVVKMSKHKCHCTDCKVYWKPTSLTESEISHGDRCYECHYVYKEEVNELVKAKYYDVLANVISGYLKEY